MYTNFKILCAYNKVFIDLRENWKFLYRFVIDSNHALIDQISGATEEDVTQSSSVLTKEFLWLVLVYMEALLVLRTIMLE